MRRDAIEPHAARLGPPRELLLGVHLYPPALEHKRAPAIYIVNPSVRGMKGIYTMVAEGWKRE